MSDSARTPCWLLDQIALRALEEALTEEMIKVAVEKALQMHRASQEAHPDRRKAIERELSLIEAHIKYLVDAIADGRRRGGRSFRNSWLKRSGKRNWRKS